MEEEDAPPHFDTFEELAAERQMLRRVNQRNGFNVTGLVTGIYTDRAHFLFELIQNAEDAGARSVEFTLEPERLIVRHDGGRLFDLPDIVAITTIDDSTKADDLTKLGHFGIGFKSVFAVTKAPEVYSGPYAFRIEDLVVPVPIERRADDDGWTTFVLVFDRPGRDPADVAASIWNRLETFGTDVLLFLRSVRRLSWTRGAERGRAARGVRRVENTPSARIVTIRRTGQPPAYYFRYSRPARVGKGIQRVSVAYRLEPRRGGRFAVVAEATSGTNLSVHFPTARPTGLAFRVNAPLQTTYSREQVRFEPGTDNLRLLGDLAVTAGRSLRALRRAGLLTPGAFDVFPWAEGNRDDELYRHVRDELIRVTVSGQLLPTQAGRYVRAGEAALPTGANITDLLSPQELAGIYGRRAWLHRRLARNTHLVRVLTLANVPTVTAMGLLGAATAAWMRGRPDTWFVALYKALMSRSGERAWTGWQSRSIFWNIALVPLASGDVTAPFDAHDRPQAYLPSSEAADTGYPVVRHGVATDEAAQRFLRAIGLGEFDALAEAEKVVIPELKRPPAWDREEAFRRFGVLVRAYREAGYVAGRRLVEALTGLPCIPGTVDGQQQLVVPPRAHIPSGDLYAYLDGSPGATFISPELELDEPARRFLTALGVSAVVQRVPCDKALSYDVRYRLREGKNAATEETNNYLLAGLDHFLARPTLARSVALWRLLAAGLAADEHYLDARYTYALRTSPRTTYPDSETLVRLRAAAWLFDRSGVPRPPVGLSLDDLDDAYDQRFPADTDGVSALAEKLGVSGGARRALRDPDQQILRTLEGYTPAEVETMVAFYKQHHADPAAPPPADDEPWTSLVPPGSGEIVDFTPSHPAPAPPGRRVGGGGGGQPAPRTARIPNKAVGKWGEEHVYRQLQRRYPDDTVTRMNDDGEQTGYDIQVTAGGVVREYAEVKATTDAGAVTVTLSGAQWRLASDLHQRGEGACYVLYVVSQAGTKDACTARLPDPVGQWQSGCLQARLVELEVEPGDAGAS